MCGPKQLGYSNTVRCDTPDPVPVVDVLHLLHAQSVYMSEPTLSI